MSIQADAGSFTRLQQTTVRAVRVPRDFPEAGADLHLPKSPIVAPGAAQPLWCGGSAPMYGALATEAVLETVCPDCVLAKMSALP